MIEEGKKNFLSLYASSLRPLIFNTDITEEDLFNFALYQSLPLDKQKNKVLMISTNGNDQVYEIKNAVYNQNTKNYESFIKLLDINTANKLIVDSILNSYKKDIYSYVLSSDKDTYAINPKIVKLQQAMLADLVSVSYKINPKKAEKLFAYSKPINNKLTSLIHESKTSRPPEYLLITPDTVAKTDLYWDEHKFDKQLKAYELGRFAASDFSRDRAFKWRADSLPMNKGNWSSRSPFDFKFDPKQSKITVSMNDIPKVINDSLIMAMKEMQKRLRTISFRFPNSPRKHPSGFVNMIPPIPIPEMVNGSLKITQQALNMVGKVDLSKFIEGAMKDSSQHGKVNIDSNKVKRMKIKLKEANQKLHKLGIDTLKY